MRQPSKDVIAHYVYAKYRRIDREYMAWNPFAPPEKPFPAKAINEAAGRQKLGRAFGSLSPW